MISSQIEKIKINSLKYSSIKEKINRILNNLLVN